MDKIQKTDYRIEKDTLGEVRVPMNAYYGAQTQRAVENFPVSGLHLQPAFIHAQTIIKKAAAQANLSAGKLPASIGNAIIQATDEVIAGKFTDQFVVDVFQAGAGTSQNMNINEVLANRAIEILGGQKGDYTLVHPNNHVNMAQSTNDTIHTAIHISAVLETYRNLLPALNLLKTSLLEKAVEFDNVLKSGRTHLQDAVPMRLGQEFSAYARMIELDIERIFRACEGLKELCIGGTAVGTGLNTDANYRDRVISSINSGTGQSFWKAQNPFEAMQSLNAVVEFSSALRILSLSLIKIADDLRLLSSGPTTGLAEILLPAVQPGSSIMPGKVNPVMAEMMNMVCYQVLGCDDTIIHAARGGQLELNVMMPVVAYNILFAIEILSNGISAFNSRCITGIQANRTICQNYVERNPVLATALSPILGYEKTAQLVKQALKENISIHELVLKEKLMTENELSNILNIWKMTELPDKNHPQET
jgi:fumarate hydratase class II